VRDPAELLPRTFCTFPREFSSLRRPRAAVGHEHDPGQVLRVYSCGVRSPVSGFSRLVSRRTGPSCGQPISGLRDVSVIRYRRMTTDSTSQKQGGCDVRRSERQDDNSREDVQNVGGECAVQRSATARPTMTPISHAIAACPPAPRTRARRITIAPAFQYAAACPLAADEGPNCRTGLQHISPAQRASAYRTGRDHKLGSCLRGTSNSEVIRP